MYRCIKTSFKTSKTDLERLFHCNRLSAQIWNDCLKIAKEYALNHNGQWINKTQLQKKLKGKYPLHSQSVQAVAHKYLQARDGAKQTKKQGLFVKYPYRKKKNFNTKWVGKSFSIDGNKIYLSLGVQNGKRQKPIVLRVPKLPDGDIKEIELIYDRGLKLAISYDNGNTPKENLYTNRTAIDLGEIHTITAIDEKGNVIIITGRKIRSIHRLRNKKLKELQKKMARCKKGSRQWKKYNRAKQYVLSKSANQLQDALHKTTREFVNWCISQQIKEVAIGNVEGVQRNIKKKIRKTTTQKLSNWSFGKTKQYLKYKLEAEGIALHEVDERYTSQTCPVCGRRVQPSGRNFRCVCGYHEHRDVVGAVNILSVFMYNQIKPVCTVKDIKYLRIT